MTAAGLSISRVEKRFGDTPALRDVSIEIQPGEFLTLLGPSGCGKSTLLRIIAGLEAHDAGAIAIGGKRVDDEPPHRRQVAMVFQNYALYPHLTAAENIAAPLLMRRLNRWQRMPFIGGLMPGARQQKREVATKVQAVSQSLGIERLLDRRPSQLSGGQRQRVALGRAMVREPVVFLMDEPLANLDASLRTHMRAELVNLHRRLGVTFIYVTHDQTEAMTMSDRIAVMFDGRVRQVGTPVQVYRQPADQDVAAFMSYPRLNLWSVTGCGDGAGWCAGVRLRLPAHLAPGSSATLAARPEDVVLRHVPTDSHVAARVDRVELLGAEALVHLVGDGLDRPVIARVDPETSQEMTHGAAVWIAPDPRRSWCFDETGKHLSTLQPKAA